MVVTIFVDRIDYESLSKYSWVSTFVHGAVNPVLSPPLPLLNSHSLPPSALLELYRQPLLLPRSHVIMDSHGLALQYFSTLEVGSLKGQCMGWME